MDEFMSVLTQSNDIDELNKEQLKEHLKKVVSSEVYDKWVQYFEFEKMDDEKLVIGYYGKASLRKFENKYKKKVWLEICSFIGCVKKLEIVKRKKQPMPDSERVVPSYIPEEDFVFENTNQVVLDVQEEKSSEVHNEAFPSPGTETKSLTRDWIIQKAIKLIKLCIVFGIIVGLVSVGALFGGNYISNRNFYERFYNIGNIKANEKIRIVQITDLHMSTYGENNSQLIKRVKKLKPDIIIYTGDCIEPVDESVKATVALCSALAKVAPSYYVYGNNEVELVYGYALTQDALDDEFGFNNDNRNPEKLLEVEDSFEEKLEEVGVNVLKNECVSITIGTTKVDIYGTLTSNPSSFWSYGGESFNEFVSKDKTNLKVHAIHEPLVFEEFESDSWGDIILAGHTHGGLVRVPVLGPLYTQEGGLFPERDNRYVCGRYNNVEKGTLIVSPGLENNNIFRINNEPELSIIDVNRF